MRTNLLQLYLTPKNYTFSSKAIMVGSSSVGKTSLLDKFTRDRFDPQFSKPTVGVNYVQTYVQLKEFTMKLDFWDTAGTDRYKTITPAFYRKSAGIIFVFDVTSRQTFEDINKWMNEAFDAIEDGIVKFLVGNKCDQIFSREVAREEGEKFAREKGMNYFETSALTGENVSLTFEKMAEEIVEKFGGEDRENSLFLIDRRKQGKIKLRSPPKAKPRNRNCMC